MLVLEARLRQWCRAAVIRGRAMVIVVAGSALISAQVQPSTQSPAPPGSLVDLALSVRERVRLQAQADRARERLRVLAREADALATQQQTVIGQLRQFELQREQALVEEEVARASETLARAGLADTAGQIAGQESKMAERAPAVRARLHRLYRLGRLDAPRYWVRTDGLVQTARAWRLLATLAAQDRDVLVEATRDLATLDGLRAQQQERAQKAEHLAAEASAAARAAVRAVTSREALLDRLDRERDLAATLVGELQQAEGRLSALLAAPPAAAVDDRPAPVLPLGAFKGDLDWPTQGELAGPYGDQRDPRFGTVTPRKGIEVSAPESTPVQAVHEGQVVFADEFSGLGRLVIVDHGGNAFSLYGHLKAFAIVRGELVARGTQLGAVGRTASGAPGVYFELRIDGQPVDPLEWLKPGPQKSARP